MSKLSVALVYNPASGSAMSIDDLYTLFSRHDVAIESVVTIGEGFEDELIPAVKKGAVIAAVGGDGTVGAVASLVVSTAATLLPLPGGTLNNFTKDLKIPQDVDEALAAAVKGHTHTIDVASVNDTYFINNSSIGLYPQSLHVRTRIEDRLGKWPAAIIGTLRALIRFRIYTITIGEETFRTPFIFVGNNEYNIADMQGTRDHLNDSILSVYIVNATTRFGLVKLFLAALIRQLHTVDSFEHRQAKSLTIGSTKHKAVHVSHDGELSTLKLPITYRIHPRQLRVRL